MKQLEYEDDILFKKKNKKHITRKDILLLQVIVMIYTLSGVAGKIASSNKFFSFKFIFFYGIEILILGVYALLWQQIIKKIDLSIAYANRSIALMWSMVWAVVLFHENVSITNIIGVLIVIVGTMIVNGDSND